MHQESQTAVVDTAEPGEYERKIRTAAAEIGVDLSNASTSPLLIDEIVEACELAGVDVAELFRRADARESGGF